MLPGGYPVITVLALWALNVSVVIVVIGIWTSLTLLDGGKWTSGLGVISGEGIWSAAGVLLGAAEISTGGGVTVLRGHTSW